ncbi:MFS transporter [Streptomyces sp. NPDC056500]|uniref:MFS transporter n=1 Tax=Streptomyces sp. NPDC056500 TaxID=3345840 RepID=UPI003692122E
MESNSETPDSPGTGSMATAEAMTSHRTIMRIIAGLLLALFSAVLSTMIVTNALPAILHELGGSQAQYTWVVVASLLTMTVSTPIWGRLSDQYSKRLLVQLALVVFVAGSAGAALAQSMGPLIAMRAVQGIAMGGLMATSQAVIGTLVSPRERGRYSGYIGAVMAGATVCGPLVGGVVVDTEWLGWRWCFLVVLPFSLVSLVLLQRHLRLPATPRRKVRADWTGAALIAVTASLPLLWVTFAGDAFAWVSWQTVAFLGGTLVTGAMTIRVERHHLAPVVSRSVFGDRNTRLVVLGSISVGVVMFGVILFLSQYFQLALGYSPTVAGLLGMPMMVGTLVGTMGSGTLITRAGRWKVFLVAGSALLVAGLALLGLPTLTGTGPLPLWLLLAATVLVGLGIGAVMQNYVLVAQNSVDVDRVGAASATVTFFRSLAGAIGVSLLGAVVTHRVAGLGDLPTGASGGERVPDFGALSPVLREAGRTAYGDALTVVFLVSAVVALGSLAASLAVRETPLRTTVHKNGQTEPAKPEGPGTPPAQGEQGPEVSPRSGEQAHPERIVHAEHSGPKHHGSKRPGPERRGQEGRGSDATPSGD